MSDMKIIPRNLGRTLPKPVVVKVDNLLDKARDANSSAAAVNALTLVLLDIADSLRRNRGDIEHYSWEIPEQETTNDHE